MVRRQPPPHYLLPNRLETYGSYRVGFSPIILEAPNLSIAQQKLHQLLVKKPEQVLHITDIEPVEPIVEYLDTDEQGLRYITVRPFYEAEQLDEVLDLMTEEEKEYFLLTGVPSKSFTNKHPDWTDLFA